MKNDCESVLEDIIFIDSELVGMYPKPRTDDCKQVIYSRRVEVNGRESK